MTRLQRLNDRYAAAAVITAQGVEMLAIGDTAGAHLDAAIKEVIQLLRQDGPELWGDVLGIARQVRWRLATEPQPIDLNPRLQELALALAERAIKREPYCGDEARHVLRRLAAAATAVEHSDPPGGAVLLRCITEIGAEGCVVITASTRASVGVASWLAGTAIKVPVVSRGGSNSFDVVDQAYAVGPPRRVPAAVVTAPSARAVTFLFPSWESDRALPQSALTAYAEGAIRPRSRVFAEGAEPVLSVPKPDVADDLVPQPLWTQGTAADRPLGEEEVLARRVLLSGGLGIYLEVDGEYIRSLDPPQPAGERVTYSHVAAVRPGTYLVLREGEGEPEALYARAVALLGDRGQAAETAQQQWKDALEERLCKLGHLEVARALKGIGVRRHERAAAWTERTVARPQDGHDFELLLGWLGIPLHPTFELATELRRQRMQASADVRESLEDALSAASMTALEEDGHLRLDLDLPGFRGIIATRVLAISPTAEPIARSDLRVPEFDDSAQWLE